MLRRRLGAAPAVIAAAVALAALPAFSASPVPMSETPSPEAPATESAVRVEAAEPTATAEAASALVASMPLREKAASVVIGHIPSADPAAVGAYMANTGIGGFLLMGANIPATEGELRALTSALTVDAALPPLIAIDQEGGDVSRLPWDGFPSALTLKDQPAPATADAFAGRAALVQRAGIGVNFGIVADVGRDPSSFIYRRALGAAPAGSAERVAAAVTGEEGEALSTLKHFPGHGAAAGDSHQLIPETAMTKAEWQSADALPFAAGIDGGAPVLMFGHLAYTAVDPAPASLSSEWYRIAREELGFTGVTVTDDLGMLQASGVPAYADPVVNAVAALSAGSDVVLTVVSSTSETAPRIVDGIVAAVESGALSEERLDEAATRVATLRLGLAGEGRGLVLCGECAPAE